MIKKAWLWFFLLVIAALLPLLLGELAIQLYLRLIHGQQNFVLDEKLGWRASESNNPPALPVDCYHYPLELRSVANFNPKKKAPLPYPGGGNSLSAAVPLSRLAGWV